MDTTKKNVLDTVKSWWNTFTNEEPVKKINSDYVSTGGTYRPLFTTFFNGEKNLGEIGPVINYRLDYMALRLRSWQSFHESEITQTIMNRFNMWVVGKGLKLQSTPIKSILESAGIKVPDWDIFTRQIEERFLVFSKSKHSDYAGMRNIHFNAGIAFKNAVLGGDVLIVMRYDDNGVNIQLIDGQHIQSPNFGNELFPEILQNGNKIINGIETDARGNQVAFYVRQLDFSIKRIAAKGAESGLQMAFMVYGLEYRLDNNRGVPLFAVVLETLKKLERYKEATVGSAEERQKIVMQIVHDLGSTGENPLNRNLVKAYDVSGGVDNEIPRDVQGIELANKVNVSTNKQTFNMPIGSKLETLDSKNELYFKDFYDVNFNIVCAAMGIPPEVANSKFENSYSSSRAALKDWEHTLDVKRNDFAFQFYQPIYNFWLECEVLNNKISAPGYIVARFKNDYTTLESYRMARFIGAQVPHIDPLKEVKAIREKLGLTGYTLPLITLEEATEQLGGGEALANMEQYAKEFKKADALGIKLPEQPSNVTPPIPPGA